MNYNLIIQAEAVLDIQEAFEWYEKAKDGLGFELIQEIERCYQKISNNAQHYGFTSNVFRSIKTNRFPYLIIFEIVGNEVFVYNFLHCKRKKKNL